jgi:hypothetical protein
MKKNPVELLSIINPEDGEKISLSQRDYQMLGVGAAAAIAGTWLIAQVRNYVLLHSPRNQPLLLNQATAPLGTQVETLPASQGFSVLASFLPPWVILGVLGVAGWYVWSKYKTSAEEPEREPRRNPKTNPHKKYHRRERKHSSGTRYFVRVSGTDEIHPKPGNKDHSGGYSLRSAQDFARIGSQTGGARKVLRGSAHGPVVRKYEDGKRVWPVTMAQARSLRPAERPSKLRESA